MREGVEMADEVAVSDAMAVERTLAGDRDAYRVLVERHSRTVYKMAYRIMGNAHDAEEVVQESFLRAYQKLKQFAGNANFGTWVYRFAANYAIDRIRQRNADEARRAAPSKSGEDSLEVDPLSLVRDMSPSPEGMRRMPRGIGPHRGGVRSAGCDADSGSGRRLRRAGVAADCSQTWREKSAVVGIAFRAATVGSPGRRGSAGDPSVCWRPIDAPPGSVGGRGRCCEGARARAGGGRRGA